MLALASLTLVAGVASGAPSAALRIEGTVTSISASSLEIRTDSGRAMTFRLVAETTYLQGAQAVAPSAVKAGARVRVKYHQEPDGSLKAKKVTILPPPTPRLYAVGTLRSIASDRLTVVVGGVSKTFQLSSHTAYLSNGHPIAPSLLRPGARVRVGYHADPGGSLRAKEVDLLQARCTAVRDVTPGMEVVLGQARTGRSARDLARRLAAKGFEAIVEHESCRAYEVVVRVRSRQVALSVVARARRAGLHPTLERR